MRNDDLYLYWLFRRRGDRKNRMYYNRNITVRFIAPSHAFTRLFIISNIHTIYDWYILFVVWHTPPFGTRFWGTRNYVQNTLVMLYEMFTILPSRHIDSRPPNMNGCICEKYLHIWNRYRWDYNGQWIDEFYAILSWIEYTTKLQRDQSISPEISSEHKCIIIYIISTFRWVLFIIKKNVFVSIGNVVNAFFNHTQIVDDVRSQQK